MGSRSRSSTSSTNTTENFTFNNVDNRVGDGGGGSAGNTNFNLANSTTGNITLNTTSTDLGAIEKAFNFADDTLELASQSAAPDANMINAIGKNAAIVAAILGAAYLLRAKI